LFIKPELREHLEEALRLGIEVQKFVAGLTLEQYSADDKTRLAVERSFEIIGEALNRSFKIAPEQIDSIRNYRQIISFRNILLVRKPSSKRTNIVIYRENHWFSDR